MKSARIRIAAGLEREGGAVTVIVATYLQPERIRSAQLGVTVE